VQYRFIAQPRFSEEMFPRADNGRHNSRREERGAIDFDTTETRVVFGEGKKIDRIVPTERNDAHRLIEECMLMANVATAGYKKSRSTAGSLPTYNVNTASGSAQVGMGSALGDISQIFQQGAFEPNASPTSMAIGGDGFFVVRDGGGKSYYTREGNFSFNQNGSLVNSQGFVVQGWAIDPVTGSLRGSLGDISMSRLTSPPEETTIVTQIVNLHAEAANRAPGARSRCGFRPTPRPDRGHRRPPLGS